ncbi:hypothetical protein SprV_0802549800 [Sparganum proliferum]
MGSSENPKRQANKALVPAITSSSDHAMVFQQLIVGRRDERARENLLSEKKDLSWEKACDTASHQERVQQNLQHPSQSIDGAIASLESEMTVTLVNTAMSPPRQRPSAPLNNYHPATVVVSIISGGETVDIGRRGGEGEAILRMVSANAPLQSPYTITLPVDRHPVKFEIDTGSAVTLIKEASLQKLPSLLPASSTFRSSTGQDVEVRGLDSCSDWPAEQTGCISNDADGCRGWAAYLVAMTVPRGWRCLIRVRTGLQSKRGAFPMMPVASSDAPSAKAVAQC